MTRSRSRSSMCSSFSRSPSSRRVTGMPVQRLTTWAIISASTSSGSMRLPSGPRPAARRFRPRLLGVDLGQFPVADLAHARSRSPSRSARSASARRFSIKALPAEIEVIRSFSVCQRADRADFFSFHSASSAPISSTRFLVALLGLLLQRRALDLELTQLALDDVELRRHRVDRHAQLRGGLVDQVDGLVGHEAVGDVAVRERAAATSARRGCARRGAPRSAP